MKIEDGIQIKGTNIRHLNT